MPILKEKLQERVRTSMADKGICGDSNSDPDNDSDNSCAASMHYPSDQEDDEPEQGLTVRDEKDGNAGPMSPRSRRRAVQREKIRTWELMQSEIGASIDRRFGKVKERLDRLLKENHTDAFWHTWSNATEEGIMDYIAGHIISDDHEREDWEPYRGRGKPTFRQRFLHGSSEVAPPYCRM